MVFFLRGLMTNHGLRLTGPVSLSNPDQAQKKFSGFRLTPANDLTCPIVSWKVYCRSYNGITGATRAAAAKKVAGLFPRLRHVGRDASTTPQAKALRRLRA